MNEIYIDPDGKKYNVGPKSKAQFLLDHPNAVLYKEPVKINPNAQGAAAGGDQAPDTASNSGGGSLVFTPPKYEEQFQTYLSTKDKNSELRLKMLTDAGMDPYAPQMDEESALNYADKIVNTLDFSVLKETEDISESLNSSLLSMIKGDRYLQNHLLKDIQKVLEPKIEIFKNNLKKDIDLTDINQINEANKTLNNYASRLYLDTVSNNRTYNKRIDAFKDAVINSYDNKFKRLSEQERQRWIDAKRSELGLTDDSKLWEGVQKGFKQVDASLRRTNISIDANELKRLNNSIEGKNDNEIAYTLSSTPGTQTYDTRPPRNVTVKQAKIEIIKKKERILNQYMSVKGLEEELQAFQKAKLDGLMPESWGDLALLVGEQAIQLPIAVLTYGTGIFAQEYGNAYFDTIVAKIEANGEEFSDERFLDYLEAGEGDGAIATVSSSIQSVLEFTGATTIVGTLVTKPGKALVRSLVKDGIKRFIKQGGLKGSSKSVARGYMVEYLTESFQTLTSQISKGFSIGDSGKYIDLDEIKQSGAQGGIVGGFLPFSVNVAKSTIKEMTAVATRVASFGDGNSQSYILKDLKKNIKASIIKGEISKVQGEQQLSAVSDVDNANIKVPSNIVGEGKQKLINLLIEESKIINDSKNLDKTFAKRNEERLNEIYQEKLKIYVTAELTDQVLKGKRFAGALNQKLKFIEVKNKKDFVKTAKKHGIKDAQENEAGRVTDPKKDGSAVVVMNMEVAGGVRFKGSKFSLRGNTNIAGHEILHNGLYKTLYSGKTTAVVELSTLLKDHLMEIDPDLFKEGSPLNQILTQYQNDPTYTEQARAEELFNAISDIYNNPLTKKPNEGFLTKLGDILRRILQDIGWKKIKFEDGADVFNFIKDYSYAVRKGKTGGGVLKAMKEGITISDKILAKSKDIETMISKASKSKKGEIDSQKVSDIYNEQGVEGANEIIKLFDPILNRITNNYKGTPNFDFDELKDAIAYDERGLLGLIMGYTKAKAKGAPLAGYINKYLARRAIEQAQVLLGEEFTLDIDTAQGTPDTTSTESTFELEEKTVEVKKDDLASKLGVDPELSNKVLEAVELAFGTKLPSISVKAFNAALTKTFRTKLKPEIVKFINDTGGLKPFLEDNFEAIYANLPLSTINKRFQAFKEPLLDKDGVQMREILPVEKGRDVKTLGQGKPLFKKRNISEKEWVDYFTDKTAHKKSALGNRKIALTEEIGVELAFDATNEILKNESIMNRFREIQELSGIGVAESYIQEIGRKIDRGYRSKASKGLTPDMLAFHSGALSKTLINTGDLNQLLNYKFPKNIEETDKEFILNFVKTLWDDGLLERYTFYDGTDITNSIKESFKILESGPFKSKPEVDVYLNDLKKILALKKFPPGLLNPSQLVGAFPGKSNPIEKYLRKKLQEFKKQGLFGKPLKGVNYNKQKPSKSSVFGSDLETIRKKATPEAVIKFNKEKAKMFWEYWNAINEIAQTNPELENAIRYMVAASAKERDHIHSLGAEIVSIDNKNKGAAVWEHAVPVTKAAEILLNAIFGPKANKDNFVNVFNNVRKQYKQIAFLKELANKAQKQGMESRTMPDKNGKPWNLIKDSWFDRYAPYAEILGLENQMWVSEGPNFFKQASKASKGLSRQFNELIQGTTGTPRYQKFSPVKAKLVGQSKGKNKFFVPYSAEDFLGLLYVTLGKGKVGDQQRQWYEDNLIRPFSKGIQAWQREKENSLREWSLLKKEASKDVPIGLTKVNESGFTNQDSIRIYMWTKQGMEIEGILKKEINENLKIVRNDPLLKAFAERLMVLNSEGYPPPTENWNSGDITTDLVGYVNDVRRAEFLEEWRENIDTVFSDQNKDKLRALYGNGYVVALEDIITRMKTGRNRRSSASQNEKIFLDWTNDSVGTIMFFNTRSALLQTISAVNFINWSDNNPLKAGMALANFPQFVKDFTFLFNSDFLKQRRSGLQIDVNADEIANSAKTSKNKVRAMLSAILQFGFTPTQIADSFAIASGGASFYRNRIDTYVKQGMSQKEAQENAFTDFMEIAEETQQSARPDRISMQQAGSLGRLILAFANTPMQYTRLTKKAFLDLINKRGDWKTNISKIVYYSVIQNIIFNSLQSALFALMFDDTTEDDEKRRYSKLLNGSIDSFVRGTGVYGAVATVIKNMVLEGIRQSKAKRSDYTRVALKSVSLSPPIDSKLRKLLAASRTFTYKQSKEKVYTEGFSLENPGFLAFGQIVSAGTNLPLDRVILKMDHLNTAMKPETELWQSIALALGYSEWDLNMIEPKAAPDIEQILRKVDRILKKY